MSVSSADRASAQVDRQTRRVARSTWGERLARTGLAARGVVFLLLAYLVLRVALGALASTNGGTSSPASLPGVADALDQQAGGPVILTVLGIGLALYALFSLIDTILHHDDESPSSKRWGDRALSAWGVIMYAGFSVYCFVIAASPSPSGESSAHDRSQKTHMTADVLNWPGGAVWLGLLGTLFLVMAVFLVSRSWRRSFQNRLDRDRMSDRTWRVATVLGALGYLGRAGLFGVVGGCIMYAAIEDAPRYGQGVNGALRVIAGSAVGPPLLGLLAALLAVYGAYMFVETRYRYV
jgi:uncharacterized BrkB/YihY/UPF0761 family membrane protein